MGELPAVWAGCGVAQRVSCWCLLCNRYLLFVSCIVLKHFTTFAAARPYAPGIFPLMYLRRTDPGASLLCTATGLIY